MISLQNIFTQDVSFTISLQVTTIKFNGLSSKRREVTRDDNTSTMQFRPIIIS